MQKIKTTVKKTIAYLAKKSANMEASVEFPHSLAWTIEELH